MLTRKPQLLTSCRSRNCILRISVTRTNTYSRCHSLLVAASSASVNSLANCKPHDLIRAQAEGFDDYLEVTEDWNGESLVCQWKGQLLRLREGQAADGQRSWTTERIGSYPPASSPLVAAFPALAGPLLEGLHGHAGAAPAALARAEVAHSQGRLEAEVAADASLWCDGTKPGAPDKTPLQAATLTAGELLCLMQGKRGVVLVQLWNGFEPSKGQPLYEPYVVRLLEAALATPGIRAAASPAPGGPAVGLTAVLHAEREPWGVWGPHLAAFGCQANAVAGSAYYKALIGKVLGYSDDNIAAYVRALGGGLTPAVAAQVDQDLKRLSKAKPKLPWNRGGSRGKDKQQAAGGGAAESGAAQAAAPGKAAADGRKGGRR